MALAIGVAWHMQSVHRILRPVFVFCASALLAVCLQDAWETLLNGDEKRASIKK